MSELKEGKYDIQHDLEYGRQDSDEGKHDLAVPLIRFDRKKKGKRKMIADGLRKIVPILGWLPSYTIRENLQGDLITGLTLGIMLLPQGMAYGQLADLPSQYGLYAVLGPSLLYLVFGTCRHMSVGPSALVSLLTATIASKYYDSTTQPEQFVNVTMQLGLLTGALLIAMAVFRLGVLATLIPESVLSGFVTASAILIIFSEMKNFLGIAIGKGQLYTILPTIFSNLQHVNWRSVLVGLGAMAQLLLCRHINKTYLKNTIPLPGPLLVVSFWTGFQYFLNVDLKIVGYIPPGLPSLWYPTSGLPFTSLLEEAALLAIISYIYAFSLANTIALKFNYKVDANQELLALGLCNFGGAWFRAYPPTGSLTRSAVAGTTGVKTPFHGLVTFFLLLIVLQLLTSFLRDLPLCVLSAIVFIAAQELIIFSEAQTLWKQNRPDFILWLIAFLATLVLGVTYGIAISIGCSLAYLIFQNMWPPFIKLVNVPGTNVYRNAELTSGNQSGSKRIYIAGFDSPLHFANREYFQNQMTKIIEEGPKIKVVILECRSISMMDISGLRALIRVVELYKKREVFLVFANFQVDVTQLFERTEFFNVLPRGSIFSDVHSAVIYAKGMLADDHPRPPANIVMDMPRSQTALN